MRSWFKWICLCALLGSVGVWAQECKDGKFQGQQTKGGNYVKSLDPNEMAGPVGFGDADPNAEGAKHYVLPGEWLEYTIYFENKSTATAAAQEVKVDADLSPYLDWTTFELGDIVVGNQTITELTGTGKGRAVVPLQGRSDSLMVTVTLNEETGHVKWYLRAYDKTQAANGFWPANAEDGFLPPNDEFHSGEGHCCYRIKVKDATQVAHGDVINAAAEIVFDSNPMIPTDPAWYNTVFAETPLASDSPIEDFLKFVPPGASVLVWKEAQGAESYNTLLQLMNGDTVEDSWEAKGLRSNAWYLPVELVNGRTYRWCVTSVNGNGESKGPVWTFRVSDSETQTLQLSAGWNWIGFQVLDENRSLDDVFGVDDFAVNDMVIHGNSISRFFGAFWDDMDLEYGKMYKVKVAHDATVVIEGLPYDNDSLTVSEGWNWISPPGNKAVTPEELTHSGGFTSGDRIIKSNASYATYFGDGMWLYTGEFLLEPGKGYKLKVANGGTVTFGKASDGR
ncbi:MAG: hypothetical protein J6X55_08050 [Victivallales bacterium]|nr:hypothetical protein [Victivallales bacterium]